MLKVLPFGSSVSGQGTCQGLSSSIQLVLTCDMLNLGQKIPLKADRAQAAPEVTVQVVMVESTTDLS